MNQKTEHWILLGLSVLFGAYIVCRAWLLPITVDESSTAINHVARLVFDTLVYQKEANPNNHILNTLLIKIFTGIFGWHHFVVRLPVLIGAFLYIWAALKLVKIVSTHGWVRIFSFVLLLSNTYLLEFFSLARGYGLAAGLMMVALWQASVYLTQNDARRLRLAVLFAGLSVYANFTFLVFFAPFMLVAFVSSWQMNRSWAAFWGNSKPAFKTLGVFLLLWIAPLSKLANDSELIHWNKLGSFFESSLWLVRASIRDNAYLGADTALKCTWLAIFGAVVVVGLVIWRWKTLRFQFHADPRLLLAGMLPATVLTNVIQVYVVQTPYLQSRLALFYWPLFALSIGVGAALLADRFNAKKAWWLMGPVLVLCAINLGRTLNLSSSYEWYHDSDTFTIFEYLKKKHQEEGRTEPYSFDTEWFMQNSFLYYLDKKLCGYEKYVKLAPYHGRQLPQRDTEFYYALNHEEAAGVLDVYNVDLRVPGTSLILLRKK